MKRQNIFELDYNCVGCDIMQVGRQVLTLQQNLLLQKSPPNTWYLSTRLHIPEGCTFTAMRT